MCGRSCSLEPVVVARVCQVIFPREGRRVATRAMYSCTPVSFSPCCMWRPSPPHRRGQVACHWAADNLITVCPSNSNWVESDLSDINCVCVCTKYASCAVYSTFSMLCDTKSVPGWYVFFVQPTFVILVLRVCTGFWLSIVWRISTGTRAFNGSSYRST